MYKLRITAESDSVEDLRGKNVLIFGATENAYSVLSISFTYLGLPTDVELGDLYPFAWNNAGDLKPCQILTPGLFGTAVTANQRLIFNGRAFVSNGQETPFYCAISNQSDNQLVAGGLAQEITMQESTQKRPLNTRPLPLCSTSYFENPQKFWIGAGLLSAAGTSFQDGMLMPTDAVSPFLTATELLSTSCQPTFWPFTTIDFSNHLDLVASYSKISRTFVINPSSEGQLEASSSRT